MSLILRWRIPASRLTTRWRGPAGMAGELENAPETALAAIIGPPGPAGPQGPAGAGSAPLRLDASLSATWVLAHALGRVPTVQVFLSGGEAVLADISATTSLITVTFPSPRQGFVLAY